MHLIEFHLFAGLFLFALLFLRKTGWRWGMVAICGWMTSGVLVVTAIVLETSNGAGQISLALASLFYVGVFALFLNNHKLFHWLVGFYGLPAVFLVLGGPA